MKSNSKEVRAAIRQHILDCVYDENENQYNNIKDAATRLNSEFERVANDPYNMKRIPNNQLRFSDYLLGLPFHFHYTYYDIETFLNGLGINPGNKKFSGDKLTKLYHYLIFSEMNKALK